MASREWTFWIAELLYERFGVSFDVLQSEDYYQLRVPGSENLLRIGPVNKGFFDPNTTFGCTKWRPRGEELELAKSEYFLLGVASPPLKLIAKHSWGVSIEYDALGFISWMLNRIEEINPGKLDDYGRFSMRDSVAFKFGFIGRPVVDEMMEIIRQSIKLCWPALRLSTSQFATLVSHDVDRLNPIGPCNSSAYAYLSIARSLGVWALRPDRRGVVGSPRQFWKFEQLHRSVDETFDWIMDTSEKYEVRSSFHFIVARTSWSKDATYDFRHKDVRRVLRRIHSRGHEICLHPSFDSFLNPSQVLREAELIKSALEEEGILQAGLGSRMHYLRYRHPDTLRDLEAANITYDSTLGFSEAPGFRCGTCFEYPSFDPLTERRLNIRIRPLIAMDVSLIRTRILGPDLMNSVASDLIAIKEACRSVRGQFTILWHNCEFFSVERRELYERVLSA